MVCDDLKLLTPQTIPKGVYGPFHGYIFLLDDIIPLFGWGELVAEEEDGLSPLRHLLG